MIRLVGDSREQIKIHHLKSTQHRERWEKIVISSRGCCTLFERE
jgi:predicted alpha/beta-fold hydrolase